jgi:hypothetical protein
MSLREQIGSSIQDCVRRGDKMRLSVLRMLLAEIEVAGASGTEFDEVAVVKAYAKKLARSADEYQRLNRPDKAAELMAERQVVEEFLPAQMSPSEVEELVQRLIEENNFGPRDLGRLMKTIMSSYADRVDGRLVQQTAVRKLAEMG